MDGGGAITLPLSAVNGSNPPAASAVYTVTKPVAGSHTLSASYSGFFASSSANASLTVNTRTLNATASASNKVYDGTTAANITYGDNRLAGDVFTISGTAAFADKNVGTG